MEDKTVSFAFSVKEEAISADFSRDASRAFLSSFARLSGVYHMESGRHEIDFSTESSQIAKKIHSFLNSLYGVGVRFSYSKPMGLRKKVKYHVLASNPDLILDDLQVDYWSPKIPSDIVKTPEMAAAYLCGAFLAVGSVNDPSSSNYHLEIAVGEESYAKWLSHLINKVQSHVFTSKIAKRRNQYIVYIKRSEQISDFLIYIGAQQSCLYFEDVRVARDYANIGNRLMILDSANMGKTMKAAERQLKEIRYFKTKYGDDHFQNPKLNLLMNLRENNPDASLDELAVMLSEEMAMTISKSNINHLFRALHEEYLKECPNDR